MQADPPLATTNRPARAVLAVSRGLLRFERVAIGGFMALLAVLVLTNVATRYAGRSIYWIDEAAVYAVVWLTFVGASAMTRMRLDFAVTMLTERLSPRWTRRAKIVSTLGVVVFGLLLGWMSVLWLDPIGIVAAGFDARELAARTFNFVYTERTQTLNWPTWVVYSIIPIFALSITIHALANLLEDLGWARPDERAALGDAASAVN